MAGNRGSWNHWENQQRGAPSWSAVKRSRRLHPVEVRGMRLLPLVVAVVALMLEPGLHFAMLGAVTWLISFATLGPGQRRQVLWRPDPT